MTLVKYPILSLLILFIPASLVPLHSQTTEGTKALDARVQKFLDSRSGTWRDMNVPTTDGKLLRDLVVKHGYTQALEIGTSTGHSGIWIAWGLSKTGGKLITIEIDEDRYKEAVANFKEAGLADYIDARLADAHDLVKELKGPFDFVFCDADKEWYKQYFIDVAPKLKVGGCYTAHNISSRRRGFGRGGGSQEFINYVESLSTFETSINSDRGGVSISYKKSEK